ncbi:ABC transporter substrate-binding protein [Schaalia hyovaginalis]|uniref:Raffinose/stachyose/melibiose transport system substrate-binding protein n=1 Tax=Schaalia hyovaginalis TaxID=29316 RepID=A0A923IXP6_9ACTO|nr:ABC transporter substrate-binding protein [Schaalia hyovaginalis]MBB6334340.1 raffinose/stachyose/melibiose transport system substrate-binding protein [Schaalia hyovaginalis]MCI7671129.1 ABC transporter substrate-binding protein [Schaalia hyovaginalis]MDY2668802.1 ABC transporter substrate-binding protein [Schaalia hyovaginalis]MDY3664644.1 ABC transporter substrate-binding protein [Schaalia hyovaginalis]MDY5506658.1 ABC transporter substrate-binding protein [Schaalia hyovaginalis]
MSKFMKVAAASVAAAAALTSLAACSSGSDKAADDKGSVYYLSFKPEQDAIWQEVAKAYTAETGVEVKVVTAASGTYEQTLKSEIAKSDAPTLFQINGPIGLKNWKDYTADLTDTDFAKALLDPSMAVTADGKVYGVPYVVEGYGIIYNQKIMDAYFALDGAKAKSMDEVTNFETLKAVADDMQAKKDQLGIDGVFASTSLKPGEDWRWQTHLADLPVYFEYQDNKVDDMTDLTFSHNEEFKNIFDLYLTDSTIDPKLASSKAVTDSMAEFALGKAAMVQNGNWAYGQIAEVAGNTVAAEDVKMLPIYTGREGEDKQGLNIGTENFFSINSQASEADQKASIDFVNWLISSEKGKKFMVEDLGFIPPFNTFTEAEQPTDPLAKEVIRYMSDTEKETVPWVFTTFPSQTFKDDFGAALSQYAAGQMDWDKVVELFKTEWKAEKGA